MEVWLEARPVRLKEVRQLVELASEAGVDGIAFNEVKSPPDIAAAVSFAHAPHIPVVTSMLIAFPRSPMVTAYGAWHLQALSDGNFELGLGTQVKGHIERRFGVPWEPPKSKMKEYVEALRAIWLAWSGGDPLDYNGRFYELTLMTDDFDPGSIDLDAPKVHTAAVNEGMCELAGEVSDGLILAEPITKRYTEEVMLPAVERGLATSGRSRSDITITGGGYIGLGEAQDLEDVREHIRYRIAFYSSTRTYSRPLALHGWEEVSGPLHELSVAQRWDEMPALISDDMLDTYAVISDYDSAAEAILERYNGIAERVYIGPFLSRSVTAANLRKVVNALKKAA